VNSRPDAFSPRLGQECQPFAAPTAPLAALFDTTKVAVVSNGRCGSSCALFSVTMAKEEGAKMVVVGGRSSVPQSYCGTVGGQSVLFTDIDSDIKTAGLKNDSLVPPDFITNSLLSITRRLAFGVWNKNEPEEWQARPADHTLLLTADMYVHVVAISGGLVLTTSKCEQPNQDLGSCHEGDLLDRSMGCLLADSELDAQRQFVILRMRKPR
jgi:hypothetical protein